jgi:hypothetical protein
MSNSGIGMILGNASVNMLYVWFIGAFVLGAVLVYGIAKAGNLRRSERERLDRNTEAAQRRDDPQKRFSR